MRVKVVCEVDAYTDDDKMPDTKINVTSHWNYNEKVQLAIGDTKVFVWGNDLIKAITNAMNSK